MKPRFNVAWIVLLIFLGTMINYMDRVNISLAAPAMVKESGWTMVQLGVVLSSFFWGYFLLQIPGGWLADRFGGRRVMTTTGYLWAVFTALTALSARSLPLLTGVRAGLGASEAANFPAGTSIVARWLSPKVTARIQGLNQSAIALGPLIATPLSVWLITTWGWQSMFYMFAVISVAWATVWWIVTKRAGLPDIPEKEPAAKAQPIMPDFITEPFKSVEVWGSSMAWYSVSYVFYFLLTFMPTYFVQAQHVPLQELSLLGTVPWAVLFISMNISGWIVDTVGRTSAHGIFWRRMMYAGAFVWTAAFMLAAKGATNAGSAVTLISLAMVGLSFVWPVGWSLPVVYARSKAGVLSGFMNSWGQVAGILAPLITGVVAGGGHWDTAFLYVSGFALLGAVLVGGTSRWSTDEAYRAKFSASAERA